MSGEEGLAAGKVGGTSSKFKLAAFGSADAVPLDGSLGKICIDGTYAGKGCFQ